jgi:hypothetical protein
VQTFLPYLIAQKIGTTLVIIVGRILGQEGPGGTMDRSMRRDFNLKNINHWLKSLKSSKSKLLIWQNINGKRLPENCFITKLDFPGGSFCITKKGKNEPLLGASPLYFYCFYRQTIFKTQCLFNSAFKVELRIPDCIMYEELRAMPREQICGNESMGLEFKKSHNSYSGMQYFKKKLLDYSQEGLAFRLPFTERMLFEKSELISIPDFQGQEKIGKVKYLRYIDEDNLNRGHFYRVGIEFVTDPKS